MMNDFYQDDLILINDKHVNIINNLINSLKKLPSIGEKSAERLAFPIMNFDEEEILLFSNSIKDVKSKIKK